MKHDTQHYAAEANNPEQVRSGRQYRVSADRTSASRKVRYVEGSRPDAENCRICQISS
jgi:hypothetical protein